MLHALELTESKTNHLISIDEPALSTDTIIGDVYKLNEAGEPEEGQKTENHHFTLEYLPEEQSRSGMDREQFRHGAHPGSAHVDPARAAGED